MNSPVTGKPMPKRKMYSQIIYKGESISYVQEYYLCGESKSKFTDKDIDKGNLNRLIAAYQEVINS